MSTATLSCPVISQTFPAGTQDPGFVFTITGTLADGTQVNVSESSVNPSVMFELQPGVYTGTVSKLGVSSLTSAPLQVTAPVTVTLMVPDPGRQATLF